MLLEMINQGIQVSCWVIGLAALGNAIGSMHQPNKSPADKEKGRG